jgi:hypothetical protein
MGIGPSLDIAGDQFTGHGKEDFSRPADTELADSVRSLQLRIGRLDSGTDFITFFPLRRLLIGVHLISLSQLCGDLQSEVTDRVSRLAAALAMVGRSDRALIEHCTRSAGISIKDGMERTAG